MHHLPEVPERGGKREREGERKLKREPEGENENKERMRMRGEADRGPDTRRQACAAKQRYCKGRRQEKAAGNQEAHFINHRLDLVGEADSSGWK